MKRISLFLERSGLNGLRRSAGYTLFSQVIATFIGSAVLLGGWTAYRDFQMQWRVSNAERQMDQYAHSAMKELVNILQWSCGAHSTNVHGRSNRLTVAIGEFANENGGLSSQNLEAGHFPYTTDNWFTATKFVFGHEMDGGFITISHQADRGLLINNVQPQWSKEGPYIWRGEALRNARDQLAAFDRRDRMRVIDFSFDYPLINDPYANLEGDRGKTLRSSVVRIKLVMQYRYRVDDTFSIYGEEYVRERVYETSVNFLNHGQSINGNFYFQHFTATGSTGF